MMPVWASVKLETQANVHSMFDSLKERNPSLYEKVADDIYCLKRDSVFEQTVVRLFVRILWKKNRQLL